MDVDSSSLPDLFFDWHAPPPPPPNACGFLATGVVYLGSTVLAGVLNAVRVPLTSVAAVVWFHDPMSGFKILSLVITVWGFGSYMVGGHSSEKKTARDRGSSQHRQQNQIRS